MAQYPSYEIADMSYKFRTLGLGYANLGAGVLMVSGISYDSEEARAISGAISAIMTGESYATSAEMAEFLGAFSEYEKNKEEMLRVIRNHRRVAYNASQDEYEKLSVAPIGISEQDCPDYLLRAARESWDKALQKGEEYGYRNAQVSLLAPTGTIGLLMDCATTGVEPDFALVKFKKLAGGGYFKIVNESVKPALENLEYSEIQIQDIITYVKGTGTLKNSPKINHETLKEKGLADEDLEKIEEQLAGVFEIQFAFNVWTLGEETMKRLNIAEDLYNDFNFNMLKVLGFSQEEMDEANEFVCGSMTIEGAPHLKEEHYSVFDCANRCGKKGERFIHHNGHIRMMAAVQPFLSGAISKTINMPNEVSIEDIKGAYILSWKLGLKATALYRDGCKLSQPLATKSDKSQKDKAEGSDSGGAGQGAGIIVDEKMSIQDAAEKMNIIGRVHTCADGTHVMQGRRQLPVKRSGITVEAQVGNQQVYIRTGEYPDGELGEVFIDMFREGAAFRSLLNCFAVAVSYGLQYGVPLEKFVEKFTFTRFDPSGFTTHPNVKMCTSVIDYVFRVLAMEYAGRTDLVQVPPKGTQKQRAEALKEIIEEREEAKGVVPISEGQEKLFSGEIVSDVKTEVGGNSAGAGAGVGAHGSVDALLEEMMGDAPLCETCGHITVRNGSCYRCLNCGNSMGCS